MVTATFTVAGDVATFDAGSFEANLRATSPVPISSVELTVAAASVRVTARIRYATDSAAATGKQALEDLGASGLEALSDTLGVPIEAISAIGLEAEVIAPPTPPPPRAPPLGSDGAQEIGAGEDGSAGTGSVGLIAGIVGLGVFLLLLLCIGGWLYFRGRADGKAAAVRGATVVVSSRTTADHHHHHTVHLECGGGGGGGGGGAGAGGASASTSPYCAGCSSCFALGGEGGAKPDGILVPALWADGELPASLVPGKPFTPFAPLGGGGGGGGGGGKKRPKPIPKRPKPRKAKDVTGLPLNEYEMMTCYGERVPAVLVVLWNGIVARQGAIEVEGLFRLAGDQSVAAAAEASMAKGKLPKDTPPECLAHLIKSFLRKLPTGLLGKLPSNVITDCDSDDGCAALMAALDPPERALMGWLIRVTLETAAHHERNKMDVSNLTLVLAPNLFGPPNASANPMEELMLIKAATTTLNTLVRAAQRGAAQRGAAQRAAAQRAAAQRAAAAAGSSSADAANVAEPSSARGGSILRGSLRACSARMCSRGDSSTCGEGSGPRGGKASCKDDKASRKAGKATSSCGFGCGCEGLDCTSAVSSTARAADLETEYPHGKGDEEEGTLSDDGDGFFAVAPTPPNPEWTPAAPAAAARAGCSSGAGFDFDPSAAALTMEEIFQLSRERRSVVGRVSSRDGAAMPPPPPPGLPHADLPRYGGTMGLAFGAVPPPPPPPPEEPPPPPPPAFYIHMEGAEYV